MNFKNIDTMAVHAGEVDVNIEGAVVLPIFQSSTFSYSGQTTYESLRYIRLNNTPNHLVLHRKLAALEGGEAALVAASGMAAISAALLAVVSAGDHLLAQDCLYGGTHSLLARHFESFGIQIDFVDVSDTNRLREMLKPNTRAIFTESITNPLMEVANLLGVVEFAREHGLISLIDSTFATPINFRPLEAGFDLVLHSCTKYLNGHTDIVAGAVVGSRELVTRVNRRLLHLGGALDPHACFLLHRGLKTVGLRVRHQNQSALKLARFLADHPAVLKVNYPGLPNSAGNAATKALFKGYGGMLSFDLVGGVEASKNLISRARIPVEAPSLGGVETLITRPATTSHAGLTAEERLARGITDSLIRLSVGVEGIEDLIEDLKQALEN